MCICSPMRAQAIAVFTRDPDVLYRKLRIREGSSIVEVLCAQCLSLTFTAPI